MNRAATLTLNAPCSSLRWRFQPFTAGAAPAFLDYAQQQTQQSQAQETMPQAQNKHKKAARAQIIKKPVPTLHNYKRITSQQAAIAQKISLYSN
ncbi:hypothetical protein J4733_13690 [Klebsiella pneumoniae]|uniref:Uncharacterized protein n=1 Tax=Klebsiella pneumoniae TaxID=573 RepID=A0A939SVT1_KLEPN|nr:hypothetical protein [Klebsiella pneumoniae]